MKVSPLFRYHQIALLLTVPALFIGTGLFLWRLWPQMRLVLWEFFAQPDPTCGCDTIFAFSNHPTFYTLMFFTALASITLLVSFIVHLIKHIRRIKRLVQQLIVVDTTQFEHDNRSYPVHIVQSNLSLIFTYGVLNPVIVLSHGAEDELTDEQVKSILLHEVGHIKKYDSVKKIILFALFDTLFFVPGIQQLKQSVELTQELSADEYAIAHTNRHSVLSALAALIHNQQQRTPSVLPSFALINERLHSLLLEDVPFPFTRVLTSLVFTIVLLLVPTALFAESGTLLYTFAPIQDASAAACIQEYEAILQSSMLMDHFSPVQCDALLMRTEIDVIVPEMSVPTFDIILINNYPR